MRKMILSIKLTRSARKELDGDFKGFEIEGERIREELKNETTWT